LGGVILLRKWETKNQKGGISMSANTETMFYTRVAPWHGVSGK
jgi:hypothetical protein